MSKKQKRKLGLLTKGKHAKKRPLSLKKLAVAVMIAGALMLVTSLIIEASNYPWERLLGLGSQEEDSVADPSPLHLPSAPPPESSAAADPEAGPTEPDPSLSQELTVLPGDEEEESEVALQDYDYQVIGIFKIPILKVSQYLMEGSGMQMKFGIGHVKGTAMPGEHGNCVVSGHRPYPFRYLDTIAAGDNVIIKIGQMVYTYQVYNSFDVLPEETWVLDDIWGEKYTLTVITCTPYMVSSHRLIVRARLTDINGQTPAEYFGEEIEESPSPSPPPEESLPPDEAPPPAETLPPDASVPPDETLPPDASVPPDETPPPDTSVPPGDIPPPDADASPSASPDSPSPESTQQQAEA